MYHTSILPPILLSDKAPVEPHAEMLFRVYNYHIEYRYIFIYYIIYNMNNR